MKKKQQYTVRVLNILERGKTITSFQAFEKMGNTRLSSTIMDLRRKLIGGEVEILMDMKINPKTKRRYGVYYLSKIKTKINNKKK